MTDADLPAALALWRVTEGMGLGASDEPPRLAAFLARNPGLSAIAVSREGEGMGGDLIGAVLCGEDGRRGYLHHLAVVRDWRRRGVARALVALCFSGLERRGIERCSILLYADNTAGERFWHRAGWLTRGDLKILQRNVEGGASAGSGAC